MPDVVLLQEAVTDPKDRVRLFATLSDKTVGEVGALHLTRATLDSRVADATLPLLATFEEFAEALPSKAALDAIDLLQLPGFLSALRVEHSLRHQVAALLACVLLSISDERRRGWCRLIGFSIQTNTLEVAARLWDVHTTKSGCKWDLMDGYEDRENVLEAGGCRCDLDVLAYRMLSMLGEGYQDRCLQVLGKSLCCQLFVLDACCRRRWTYYGARRPWVDEDGELRQRRGKLDVADVAYLRCLMRRYGWERSAGGVEVCSWSECFPSSHNQNKKYVQVAWMLVTQLLHPRNTPSLQALPITVQHFSENCVHPGPVMYLPGIDETNHERSVEFLLNNPDGEYINVGPVRCMLLKQ